MSQFILKLYSSFHTVQRVRAGLKWIGWIGPIFPPFDFRRHTQKHSRKELFLGVAASVFLFIAVNVFGSLFGRRNPAGRNRVDLSRLFGGEHDGVVVHRRVCLTLQLLNARLNDDDDDGVEKMEPV